MEKRKEFILSILIVIILLFLSSCIGLIFKYWKFNESNIIIVYVLGVIISAKYTYGYAPSFIMAFLVSFCFNYFFTAPYYTFRVADPNYFIVFAVMTSVSLLTSGIANKMKEKEKQAKENAGEKDLLLELTRDLNNAREMIDVAKISINAFNKYLGIDVGCAYLDNDERLERYYLHGHDNVFSKNELEAYDELMMMKNYSKDYIITDTYYDFLIRNGEGKILGIIQISKENSEVLDADKINFYIL